MTMTRVSFCPKCYSAGRPKTDQQFVVWGCTHESFIVRTALRQGIRGFTPHTYEFKRLVDDTVYYDVACSMVGCGAIANPDKENKNMFKVGYRWDNQKMPLGDWNGLVRYKRDSDFEI